VIAGVTAGTNHLLSSEDKERIDVGLIEKSIRQRGNQKLAAPVYTNTTLSQAEVIAAINQIGGSHNAAAERKAKEADAQAVGKGFVGKAKWEGEAKSWRRRKFFVSVQSTEILIGYRGTPDSIQKLRGKRLSSNADFWLASVLFPKDAAAPEGQRVVKLMLKQWVNNKSDGRMASRGAYEGFSEQLADALAAGPPNGA
jgi:hypothetical protein